MFDFGKIKFIQEYDDHRIEHEIRGDASLDDVVDAFEAFLKGAGYHLKEGMHIGYEYDEEESEYQERKEMYDAMDDMIGSKTLDDVLYSSSFNVPDGVGIAPAMSTVDNYAHSEYYYDTDRNKK